MGPATRSPAPPFFDGVTVALALAVAAAAAVSLFAETRIVGRGVPLAALSGAATLVAILHYRERIVASQREAELDRIFRLSRDMLCVADFEGRFRRVNPAFERVLGWTEAELLARPLLEFVHPEDRERTVSETASLARGEPTLQFESRYLHKDGSAVWLSWTATPDLKRGLIHAGARDVTEQRRAAEELRAAKEAAESAARARAAFLAAMSHEIRTPLNAVIGMGGLLLDTPLTPRQREYAETLRGGGEALLSVVDGILDFSKLESGKLEMESAPFDPAGCVEDSLALVAPRAAAKGIELTGGPGTSLPPLVLGDPARLRQVLVNLLGNAVKFTEKGEVELTADAAAPAADGAIDLSFSVRDTGIGIPADRLDRLFRPFSQADASTTRRYGGTGLGLAISRELCERMGGRIGVESVPGRGSTFRFSIRVRAAAGAPAPAPDAGPLAGKRALVASTRAGTRRAASAPLTLRGIAVEEAPDGPAALRLLAEEGPFDLAVLDGDLAAADGTPLPAALGRLGLARAPRVVVLVPLGTPPDAGGAGVLQVTKPPRRAALLDAATAALGGRRGTPAAKGPGAEPVPEARRALRILVAEDNPMNRQVALRLLENLGCGADFAEDGLAAVEAEGRRAYDLVLLDMHMPGIDGLEAARRIRARHGAGGGPRLVALTASALQEDREACAAAGMHGFLAKPLRVDELRAVVDGVPATAAGGPGNDGDGVLDPTILSGIRDAGGPALVVTVVDLFLGSTPGYAARIRDGLARGDATAVSEAAHTLRGSALNAGARRLASVAEGIERAAARGDLGAAAETERGLDGALVAAWAALREARDGNGRARP